MRTPSIAAAAVLYVCTLVPAAIASVPARSSLDADLGAALTAAPLSPAEFDDLVAFVRDGLHDRRVNATNLCRLVPSTVPSGRSVLFFEGCH